MRRISALAVVCLSLMLTAPTGSGMQGALPLFEPVGLQAQRGYFAQLPFEHVDMINGNLVLTFTDLALPGNGGMDLRIVRSYNHQAPLTRWSFGFSGVPLRLEQPEPSGSDLPWEPTLVTGEGNRIRLYGGRNDEVLVTSAFWRYERSSRTLSWPNGWTATFESGDPSGGVMLAEVHDVYGNSLDSGLGGRCTL